VNDNSREFSSLPAALMLQIDQLCSRLESSWQTGSGLNSEGLLSELQNLTDEQWQAALAELLPLELEYRRRRGEVMSLSELAARFPASDPAWLQQVLGCSESETILGNADSDSGGFAIAVGGTLSVSTASAIPERLGDYRLLEILGQGGMGTVYRAVHERMGRAVAVKVLRAEIRGNAALLQRFEREVRTAARLIHPNIVTALDARMQDGLPFLVTELVDGEDLETQVRRDGPLAVDAALDVIAQTATGLAYAHEQGVVPRDIKPANLLRDRRGVVRILDMGLARLDEMQNRGGAEATDLQSSSGLTDSGLIMGTAAYMAPEQARDTRKADARSDLYSLGCTLHFLLTGRPPYSAASAIDMIVAHLQGSLPRLQESVSGQLIPELVQELFEQLVAKRPEHRLQTAVAVADHIARLRESLRQGKDQPVKSPIVRSPSPRIDVQPRAMPVMVWVTLSLLALLIGLYWFSTRNLVTPVPAFAAGSRPENDTNPDPDAAPALAGEPPAITFDGINGYLNFPAVLSEPGAAYTLEAIIRPRRFQTSNVLSWLGPDWMALYISDTGQPGTARLFRGQSTVLLASVTLEADRWTHLAAVFESGRGRLFVDGREETLAPISFKMTETAGGLFACGVDTSRLPEGENRRFFSGSLRGFRVSRGVRYTGPFTAPAVLEEDLQTIAAMRPNADQSELVFRNGLGEELRVVPSAAGLE